MVRAKFPDEANQLFSLYVFCNTTGDLLQVISDVEADVAQKKAMILHATNDVGVKVVDQFDGCVIYTVGV